MNNSFIDLLDAAVMINNTREMINIVHKKVLKAIKFLSIPHRYREASEMH